MEIPHHIIAVDPGESTGAAEFIDGLLGRVWILKGQPEIFNWLTGMQPDVFLVEDFRVDPRRNLAWNQLIAVRIIGAIEYRAYFGKSKVVKQSPSVKPAAYGLSGMKYKKGASNAHIQDAIAHGSFYLHKEYGYVTKKGGPS